MASLTALAPLLTPKVVTYLKTPSGLPTLPYELGYEVKVSPTGDPYRTGAVVPTGITRPTTLGEISKVTGLLSAFPGPVGKALGVVSGITGSINTAQERARFSSQLASFTTQWQQLAERRVDPMALNIGGILGQVGTIFGGGQNQIFSGISNVANLASQFFPQTGTAPAPVTALAVRPAPTSLGMLPALGRGAAMVGRSFFNRFPNLATAMQQLRDRGQQVTRGQLFSLLKRFGPEVLITGGLLTAAAVSELMVAGPGRRRMNPANVHALRRSARRIKSFHKLCQTVDLIKTKRTYGGSRRCGTCRKSPCRC